jgi:hypothetical protein
VLGELFRQHPEAADRANPASAATGAAYFE